MELLEILNWRYATKAMTGAKADDEKIEKVLDAIRLAPTSSGLQPFEVLIVKSDDLKKKIRSIAFDQGVVEDCSHLLVFAAWDDYTAERINSYFEEMVKQRGFNERLDNYRNYLLSIYPGREADANYQHAARQAYIAFGFAIVAAAELKLDSTPMEGFDADALDALLDLRSKGLRSVTMLPIGYRDIEKDWMVNMPKVRKPNEMLFSEIA